MNLLLKETKEMSILDKSSCTYKYTYYVVSTRVKTKLDRMDR